MKPSILSSFSSPLPLGCIQSFITWLGNLSKITKNYLIHQDDLIVQQEIKDGYDIWHVLDTATGRSSYFMSMHELLIWLDRRY